MRLVLWRLLRPLCVSDTVQGYFSAGLNLMRAIVAHAAKDIRIEEREPRAPGPDEVQVQIARGGICGSDLHYYNHGGFGPVQLREPMILGHEVSGRVIQTGENATEFSVGQLVAISPSRPCKACSYCLQGLPNHCLHMRFYGSAMPYPHIQGAFREIVCASIDQCADATSLTEAQAAMAEPLAVAIHATKQAGSLVGKRVLITGCGPIGLLCVMAARAAGAVEIVATDIAAFSLQMATQIGADQAIDVSTTDHPFKPFTDNKGHFDTLFECSGVASALAGAIPAIKPQGTIVQLGLGGDMTLPVQAMTAKELSLKGSFRFHEEFHTGVAWMAKRQINVDPLITHTLPLSDAVNAFELANDRTQALKVQLALN